MNYTSDSNNNLCNHTFEKSNKRHKFLKRDERICYTTEYNIWFDCIISCTKQRRKNIFDKFLVASVNTIHCTTGRGRYLPCTCSSPTLRLVLLATST